MMNDTVARIVEIMFQDVEENEEVAAIRDEVMNNCQERYQDLVSSGVGEDDAVAAVIESLKGMEEVLAPYRKKVHRPAEDMDDMDDEASGEQHAAFASYLVNKIDVALVNEDVNIEASDDDCYHVIWDADKNPLINVELHNDLLRITRRPGDAVTMNRDGELEYHHKDGSSDYVRTEKGKLDVRMDNVRMEDGKIEIDMDGIGRMMKSVGEKMKLMFSEGLKISVGKTWGRVTIQVPENAIPHVKLLTTSGDIHVEDVGLTDLSVTSTSGDINVSLDEDQHVERIDMRTTSGDMEISAFADRMDITSTSGDVEVEGRVNDLTVNTISGDIDVRADVVYMHFKAISGDVDMAFESDEIREVRGSTISGDIDIDLPEGIGTMAIQTQTRSGDVTTRCHTNGVGPTVNGNVSSMSGDITIR